jgi:hypothetical protein
MIKFMSAADKAYGSPYGRTFQTYAKAKQYWEEDRQSLRKAAGLNKGTTKRSSTQHTEAEAAKDWPLPENLDSLISWLREASQGAPTAASQEYGSFIQAVVRARAALLDVRSTRRT